MCTDNVLMLNTDKGENEGVIREKKDGFYRRAFFGQQMGETVAWAAECERES